MSEWMAAIAYTYDKNSVCACIPLLQLSDQSISLIAIIDNHIMHCVHIPDCAYSLPQPFLILPFVH